MGSRLGRPIVNSASPPIKLLMPSTLTNIKEIVLKTIPSASKTEIKRVLESLPLQFRRPERPNPQHARQEEEGRRHLVCQTRLQEGLCHIENASIHFQESVPNQGYARGEAERDQEQECCGGRGKEKALV
ncbi:hypothetical protein SLE2022_297640 [Rubroshorea leprosula]